MKWLFTSKTQLDSISVRGNPKQQNEKQIRGNHTEHHTHHIRRVFLKSQSAFSLRRVKTAEDY